MIMKKSILSMLLVLTCWAQASAYSFEVDGIYYNKNGSNATVTYCDNNYNSYSGEVTIPSTVTFDGTTYTVTAIGDCAFMNCTNLKAIDIPEGVTIFGSSAFKNCASLESVIIPEGVTAISYQCFFGCSNLKELTIPASVTFINEGYSGGVSTSAFYGCDALSTLTWNAVRCDSRGNMPTANIETVNIGDEVTLLPNYFVKDSKITHVEIPATVTNIGDYAFSGCTGLAEIAIPDNVTVLSHAVFDGCSNLATAKLPANAITIGDYAFQNCIALTEIVMPESVASIGNCAFNGCSNLASAKLPSEASYIGECAFKNCSSLESVIIPEGVTSIPVSCFFGCSNLKVLTIPSTVTSIYASYGYSAFQFCDALTTLTWNAVRCESRGDMPTANIETVTIGGQVTLLPNYFVRNSKITQVDIPATVTSIGDYAFSGCTGLAEIAIPDNVTAIGTYAFAGCTGLAEIAIPDNVTVLSHAVFDGCSNLATAKLPANAITIGDYAFQNCIALTEIVMPESVASIGNCAFNGCSNLASAKLPSEASYIGECAFKNCSSLESVIIPEGVTSIPVSCFFGCSNLKVLTIPSTVTSIYASYGYSAFQFCDALTTLTWNAVRCESRGDMPTANIETVTIGGQVTLLPNYFVRNSKITQVDIPATVTSIGDYAFAECGDLTTVTCRSITPPAMAAHNCFDCYKTAILFVPKAAVDTYLGADYWKEFFEIIGINFDTIPGDVNGDGSVNITDLNIIIGLILSNEYNYAADLNNDRSVNISDVNMIIFIILNGTSIN